MHEQSGYPHIASGFGFLNNTAGFDVNVSLIPFGDRQLHSRVPGRPLNTLLVSVVGIVFATLLGFIVALGRLSPNWLMARIAGGYVEPVRNLPLLFQMLFWYLAVLAALPGPRQSISRSRRLFPQQPRLDRSDPVASQAWIILGSDPDRDHRLGF